jgi:hypothetical protein
MELELVREHQYQSITKGSWLKHTSTGYIGQVADYIKPGLLIPIGLANSTQITDDFGPIPKVGLYFLGKYGVDISDAVKTQIYNTTVDHLLSLISQQKEIINKFYLPGASILPTFRRFLCLLITGKLSYKDIRVRFHDFFLHKKSPMTFFCLLFYMKENILNLHTIKDEFIYKYYVKILSGTL